MKIVPKKLKIGDEIRVIAPSRSMKVLKEDVINLAIKRLEEIGLKVTFGKNVMKYKNEYFKCATINERIEDLHEAFKDKNVKAIITVIGGYNVNQILEYIDYKLIQKNPKIICGFSDNTALVNAIYAKTNVVTYLGVQFFSFGMKYGFEYSMEYFKKMFFENGKIEISPSKQWSNDKWLKNQEDRNFINNEGMKIINEGEAEGKIIGGNLCTLNLLQGTEYMPDLDNSILFIEASTEVLVKRFKETRRSHPLMKEGVPLTEAVQREREMLLPVRNRANYVIDTSVLSTAKLRGELIRLFAGNMPERAMTVNVISFGFKYGIPLEADLVIDVRLLPNPFYLPELRGSTGLDTEVRNFVFSYPQTTEFVKKLEDLLDFSLPLYVEEGKTNLVISIGCTGGKHRSVAVAKEIGEYIAHRGYITVVGHRDMGRN